MIAITAGVCEEIIFRGVMLYYLSYLPFELPIIAIGIISSLLFGIVHLYQGWKGVLLTTYLGAIFFLLFVGTGYLWFLSSYTSLLIRSLYFCLIREVLKRNNLDEIKQMD
ncbi:CPBP family intramembrane glutamic endopeptidase [Oceanobacillus arenosus]|uniref:CPBP family intramembrane glutamic endopeptidase n=1 Tax=Oceanobacillus arenosus TaxID=1229153 RepID=UPI001472736E|nr:CPBP family intramembrane glutamic endopeptidase [Oceanobacillus arenosus]